MEDNDYKNVINKTKKIENILEEMGAEGRGLHEKVSSIDTLLNQELINQIRFMATIRNKLLHEEKFNLTSEMTNRFNNAYENVTEKLETNEEKLNLTSKSKDSDDSKSKSNYGVEWTAAAVLAVVVGALAWFSS